MNSAVDMVTWILIASSIIVLILETIAGQQKGVQEKSHIWLFSCACVCLSFFVIFFSLSNNPLVTKRPALFIKEISSVFLCINTLISIFLIKRTLKNQSLEFYFFILASLALAIANVNAASFILKMASYIAWLVVMTTLTICSTEGGKKAEIGLKMSMLTMIVIVASLLAAFFLSYTNPSLILDQITLQNPSIISMLGLLCIIIVGLAMTGTPPLNFSHIDCADGSNIGVAFLFLSNSIIQGGLLLSHAKFILIRSGINTINNMSSEALMLVLGFMILWLRALDQSKIRRTISYIATSVGPLFAMSMLFGVSLLLPKLIYLCAIFCFATLTLYTLFASLADMGSLATNWQTWEDLSGFGKTNPTQILTLLTAIASIAGLPGTLGYFIKLSLIAPFNESFIFGGSIFLSIAIGAACTMRIFVFAFSKHSYTSENRPKTKAHFSVMAASLVLIGLGFFPFVR